MSDSQSIGYFGERLLVAMLFGYLSYMFINSVKTNPCMNDIL